MSIRSAIFRAFEEVLSINIFVTTTVIFPLGSDHLFLLEFSLISDQMGSVDAEVDKLFEEKKRVRNPLVPIGALMTAGVLTAGLISFKQGNSLLGQKLMRVRVVVQGATVALMVGTAYYYGENISGSLANGAEK